MVDFELYGLAETWPSEWLEMIEAGGGRPPWGVTLGHGDGSRLIDVTTFGRQQFDDAMGIAGDRARELAFHVAHGQVNRSLAMLTRPAIDSAPELIRRLAEYAERQARDCGNWPRTAWTLQRGTAAERVRVYTSSFAGWQSGFTADPAGHYLIVHALGADIADLTLTVVGDPGRYGLDPDAPRLPRYASAHFPSGTEQALHADHLAALAHGPEPDSRIVWPERAESLTRRRASRAAAGPARAARPGRWSAPSTRRSTRPSRPGRTAPRCSSAGRPR